MQSSTCVAVFVRESVHTFTPIVRLIESMTSRLYTRIIQTRVYCKKNKNKLLRIVQLILYVNVWLQYQNKYSISNSREEIFRFAIRDCRDN